MPQCDENITKKFCNDCQIIHLSDKEMCCKCLKELEEMPKDRNSLALCPTCVSQLGDKIQMA